MGNQVVGGFTDGIQFDVVGIEYLQAHELGKLVFADFICLFVISIFDADADTRYDRSGKIARVGDNRFDDVGLGAVGDIGKGHFGSNAVDITQAQGVGGLVEVRRGDGNPIVEAETDVFLLHPVQQADIVLGKGNGFGRLDGNTRDRGIAAAGAGQTGNDDKTDNKARNRSNRDQGDFQL